MPALPDVPNVLKCEFLWSQNGIPAANVRYILYSGTVPDAGSLNTIAQAISDPFVTGMMPGYSAETIFQAIRLTDLTTTSGAESTYSWNAPGTDEAPPLPANCCILVNQTIARRYRGGHPRQYYPAPAISTPIVRASTRRIVIVMDWRSFPYSASRVPTRKPCR